MATAWVTVAAIVGVLVGRMIRARDRQVPPPPDAPPATEAAQDDPAPGVHGHGRQHRS